MKGTQTDWICIQTTPFGEPWFRRDTIDYCRRKSIALLLKESSMTWEDCKKHGWICKKVKIEITVI